MRRAEIQEPELYRLQDVALGVGLPLRLDVVGGEATFTVPTLGQFSTLEEVERALLAVEVSR